MKRLDEINGLPELEATMEFERCCGSTQWAEKMMRSRPFKSEKALFEKAEKVWRSLKPEDWREAFSHHPKIGDIQSLRKKYSNTRAWAEGEQEGVQRASEAVLEALAKGNEIYEDKFGFIFIACATGKSAEEMLALLKKRLNNSIDEELVAAAEEQSKITRIRLEKVLKS